MRFYSVVMLNLHSASFGRHKRTVNMGMWRAAGRRVCWCLGELSCGGQDISSDVGGVRSRSEQLVCVCACFWKRGDVGDRMLACGRQVYVRQAVGGNTCGHLKS
jgi:hypothetical protein